MALPIDIRFLPLRPEDCLVCGGGDCADRCGHPDYCCGGCKRLPRTGWKGSTMLLGRIQPVFTEGWRAAAQILEKSFPELWGRKE